MEREGTKTKETKARPKAPAARKPEEIPRVALESFRFVEEGV